MVFRKKHEYKLERLNEFSCARRDNVEFVCRTHEL